MLSNAPKFFVFIWFIVTKKKKISKEKEIVKTKIFMCEINIIIILIYQKLGLVGPVQQKIRLPLPYVSLINVKVTVSSEMKHEKTVSNNPV